jgi:serine/threonine-protein kinase
MEKVSSGKIGRYEILRVLGRGGMGEVLLAEDENLGRRVAIKRPFKSAVAEGLARFQVEAKAATLRHPNIPAVYEMGVHDDLPFIAMEYVEGESLEKIIDSRRELDLITKLRIIEQVSSALGYAHENGIIHRDIKPANIIVQPDGVTKIIDFGIAKFQDDESNSGLTKASQLIGSLHYIAPERFWGGTVDGRADIFSAGVTLFKLLTGTEPFVGGEATASFKIMNEAHAPLSAYLHDYPPALDEVVAKSLAKNPEDRYQTGEDFSDALHEIIEDLKRSRVSELFNDAERLTTERRYVPALELLDEAIKLDPSNTQARKLRKLVREHQERIRRAERLRDCLLKSEEALVSEKYDEALTHLKDASNLDSASAEIKARIEAVEEKKRRYDRSAKALMEAEITKSRGDVNGAMRILAKALEEDRENKKLMAASTSLARELEAEAQRSKLLELIEACARALGVKNFEAADTLLTQASEIDASNVEVDKLRRELSKSRELEQRRAALEEIEAKVHEFLRTDAYAQASDLLNRALEKLPNESMLHRLKAAVDAEARKFETRRFVDSAISRARELFTESPVEALSILQKALDEMPGEERLVAYEAALRRELESSRSEQLRESTVLKARELMAAEKLDQAIDVLETYQTEFGQHADIDGLLAFARGELATRTQAEAVSKCISEARALMRDGRLDQAVTILQSGLEQTSDNTLSLLLEEVRQQQATQSRKLEALNKRVAGARSRGAFDEAIRLVQEQLAATPGDGGLQTLLAELQAEFKRQEVTRQAIQAAMEAADKNDFASGLQAVQAVSHAYGDSPELARAVHDIEQKRSSYAREMVGQSIDSARAALLKKDPKEALESLKGSTSLLEYADAQKQEDWKRLGQAVKKALQESGATGSHGAFDRQLDEIAQAKPRRLPTWALGGAAAVVVAAVSTVVVLQLRKPPTPPASQTQIQFPKVPAGAQVAIDGVPQKIGPNGSVIAVVKPGHHEISVTMSGFEPFGDALDVAQGQSVREDFRLTPLPPAGVPTGDFAVFPQSDLPNIRVFVNGELKGEKHAGQKITLPVGTYRVKYGWPGYQESPEHQIQIAKEGNVQDHVILAKLVPVQAAQPRNGATQSPAAAQNQASAPVPATPVLPSGKLEISSNSVERGQPVTLSWQVTNASSVTITDIGSVAPQGTRQVYPTKSTVYQLIANGSPLAEQNVEVHDAPKAEQAAPSAQSAVTQAASVQPSGPDKATLERALAASYESVFTRASGKSSKECKAAFGGVYGGRLRDFTSWCDLAKSFTPNEQCTQVGGSPDAPTLSCTEKIVVRSKDGGTPDFPSHQKTFRFTKGADGNWQVAGW